MSMIICILIFVVASHLTKGSSLTDEEKRALHVVLGPIVTECSLIHGVSIEDLRTAKEAQNFDLINPCFIGCLMQKSEIMNDYGLFTPQKGLTKLKALVQKSGDFAKVERISKKCIKVNDEPVDAKGVCERAKLIVHCIMENKEFPI